MIKRERENNIMQSELLRLAAIAKSGWASTMLSNIRKCR